MGKDDGKVVANPDITSFMKPLNCIRSKVWPLELWTIADKDVVQLLLAYAS